MIIDISAIVIASFSFILSIYVIFRDIKNKKYNNLYAARDRIYTAFGKETTLTPDEMAEFFENNTESYKAQKYKAESKKISRDVDRELEFLCYLVIKKQVSFEAFFDLFHKWLAMREIIWEKNHKYKQTNLPYTWKIIQIAKKKKLLPLKKL